MPVKSNKMGPGTLTIGVSGTLIEISCQITEAVLSPDKDKEDDLTTLCGDTLAGEITYTWNLKGTLVQDWSATGINKYAHDNAGTQQPFTFTPDAAGPTLSGTLTVDPIDFGGKVKERPTADFEFSVVGKPVWTPAP
jgi:hypothetical protein